MRQFSEPPRVLATAARPLREFLANTDVNLHEVLEENGIASGDFDDLDTYIDLNRFSALLVRLAELTKNPNFGLAYGLEYAPGSSGAFGYVILNSPTLSDAIRNIVRYIHLFINVRTISYYEQDRIGFLEWQFPIAFSPRSQVVDMLMALLVQRLRLGFGATWQPLAVELEHRLIGEEKKYQDAFGGRVLFDAPCNRIVFHANDLHKPMPDVDHSLYAVIATFCERLEQEQAAGSSHVRQIRMAIADGLANGETTIEQVAQRLTIAPRELIARLDEAGTNFQTVFDNTRVALANYYLIDTELPLTDIALLLGFSELSALSRASNRWFGLSPRAYRREHRQDN